MPLPASMMFLYDAFARWMQYPEANIPGGEVEKIRCFGDIMPMLMNRYEFCKFPPSDAELYKQLRGCERQVTLVCAPKYKHLNSASEIEKVVELAIQQIIASYPEFDPRTASVYYQVGTGMLEYGGTLPNYAVAIFYLYRLSDP